MIGAKVLNYLEGKKVKFEVIDHRKVFTAYDLAQTLKHDLKKIAKTLLVKADSAYVLVVIPAYYRLDLKKLKKSLNAKKIEIPNEKVIIKVLKIKLGGITPFGALHKVETWVDKSLLAAQDVIMNAGSFTQSLRMKARDYIKLEEARLGNFVESAGYKPIKIKSKKSKSASKVKVRGKKKKAVKSVNKKKKVIKKKKR
ncbi:MAG: YbaK/EbsC family protein [Patescibacteria group bacterium]|jgi:Ala-tRNA(Pro) deacylase